MKQVSVNLLICNVNLADFDAEINMFTEKLKSGLFIFAYFAFCDNSKGVNFYSNILVYFILTFKIMHI